MTKQYLYDGTFVGYAGFTHFLSQNYPARKVPLATFDRVSGEVYIKEKDTVQVIKPGEVYEVTVKIEIKGVEDGLVEVSG